MRVQTFRPQAPVERFDEGVVGRFAWPREVQRDAPRIRPEIEISADELRALVDADRLGIACGRADPLQARDDVFGAIAEPRIDNGRVL